MHAAVFGLIPGKNCKYRMRGQPGALGKEKVRTMHCVTKYLLGVTSVMLASISPVALADMEQDRAEGIAWLLKNQNGDGSWGKEGGKVAATAEALAALRNSGADSGFLYSRSLSWLANVRTDSVDSLARKIVALQAAGLDVVKLGLVDDLLALQNVQKGWGTFNGHSSGFPDTALALEAIRVSKVSYPDLTVSLNLIRQGQTAGDSGWSYIAGSQGQNLKQQISPSAYNLLVLSAYQAQSNSSSYITRGINWLTNTVQRWNGSFLEDGTIMTGAVHKTALGYLAIKAANNAGIVTANSATALANAQTFIFEQQSANGSWKNDPFATALALRTLPATSMADTDGDGIPDAVETLIGTNANVADGRDLLNSNGLDPDKLQNNMVGQPVIREILKNQWFSLTPILEGGEAPFQWRISSGKLPSGITLQSSSNGMISGTPTTAGTDVFSFHVTDTNEHTQVVAGHIRVLASNDLITDTDQDGAPSTFELAKGFDPLDANSTPVTDSDRDGVVDWNDLFPGDFREWADNDRDGIGNNADHDDDNDGMPDSYEQRFGLNPYDPSDASFDSDGDGLSNLQESRHNTNPFVIDTDGDGVDDATEVAQGRNPNIDEQMIPVIITIITNYMMSAE